jgi:hypothetical protein
MASCEWFAMCDNDAVGTTPHPVLGTVDICDRCATRHGLQVTRWMTLPAGWRRLSTDRLEELVDTGTFADGDIEMVERELDERSCATDRGGPPPGERDQLDYPHNERLMP